MLSPSHSCSSFVSLPKIVSDVEGYGWLALVALWGSWSPGSPRDLVLPNGSPPFWEMFLFLQVPRYLAGPRYQCLAGYPSELLLFLGQWTHGAFWAIAFHLSLAGTMNNLRTGWDTHCLPQSCCFLSCRIFCRIPLSQLRQVLRAFPLDRLAGAFRTYAAYLKWTGAMYLGHWVSCRNSLYLRFFFYKMKVMVTGANWTLTVCRALFNVLYITMC